METKSSRKKDKESLAKAESLAKSDSQDKKWLTSFFHHLESVYVSIG